ncbi:unnamed protein product, partial [Coregonus sp. 'balchen']
TDRRFLRRTAQGQQHKSPAVSLNHRCSKVLRPLVEQLQQVSASSDPSVTLSLIKFIHWSLREIDNSTQTVALSSTLRHLVKRYPGLRPSSRTPAAP